MMMDQRFKRGRFFMFPLVALAFVAAGGAAVMFLWNAILPAVIPAVGSLSYLQAAGLLLLCRILFGGFKGRGGPGGRGYRGGPPWRQKMMAMSDEEREKFRNEWKDRCGKK